MKHIRPHGKKPQSALDRLVLLAGVISPVMTIPQAWQIWSTHTAAGVSLVSWATYLCISLVWLAYGWKHNERAILLAYTCWFSVEAVIVAGILTYR